MSELTCVPTGEPGGHVFTALYPGWEPDDATPCDCGCVSWGEERRARLRKATEAGLAREADKRRTPPAPGPDPDLCNAPHPSTGICGGRMSPPIRGTRTGLWLRTCRDCMQTTGTTEAPANTKDRVPIGFARTGEIPFTTMETIARRTSQDLRDARQRHAGSDS